MGLGSFFSGIGNTLGSLTGSVRNGVDSTFGHTGNWRDSINTPSKIVTTPAVGLEGGEWGAHFGGRYSAPVGDALGHMLGNEYMAKNKLANKSTTKHQDATAYHSAHHSGFTASKSTHNTTQYKKKR